MITIDPYDMRLRRTYDMQQWMKLNDSMTAAHYDYDRSIYHLFFENNVYRTWTVNRTLMGKLPMGWDRAYLHGTLSKPMKINRDFFGFPVSDTVEYSQPYLERYNPTEFAKPANRHSNSRMNSRPFTTTSTTTTTTSTTTTTTTPRPMTVSSTTDSDFLVVTNHKNINKNRNRNSNLKIEDDEEEHSGNLLERDESINYQKQLMDFERDGVKDFASDVSINSLPRLSMTYFLYYCIFFIHIFLFCIIL